MSFSDSTIECHFGIVIFQFSATCPEGHATLTPTDFPGYLLRPGSKLPLLAKARPGRRAAHPIRI